MSMVLNHDTFKKDTKKEKEENVSLAIDNILNDLEYYMFNKEMILRLEDKPDLEKKETIFSKSKSNSNSNLNINMKSKPKEEFFSPKQKDGLFWCFYVMKNGETAYELLNNDKITLITEKKIKIDYVDLLRKEKNSFKKQCIKFPAISHMENDLVNEQIIDIGTFLSLCHLEKLNVLYVYKKTYFELNENEGEPVHIVQRINEASKPTKYIYYGTNTTLLEKYRMTLFKVENIEKPVKALSAYKIADLIEFCQKLGLETTYHDEKMAKIKNKSKQMLYEQIVQYF